MSEPVTPALLALYDALVRLYRQQEGCLPYSRYRDDWDSPCVERLDRAQERIYWRPAPRADQHPLPELERGLEVALHPDLEAFYGCLWADGIRVDSPWGEIGLIQVWNPDDLENLKENLLGHAFARLKKRLPLSFFIGIQKDERIVSIDNERGVIQRERPGRRGDEILCSSLGEFLTRLTPNLKPYDEFG